MPSGGTKQLAKRLGITDRAVRKAAELGRIRAKKAGRRLYFPDLDKAEREFRNLPEPEPVEPSKPPTCGGIVAHGMKCKHQCGCDWHWTEFTKETDLADWFEQVIGYACADVSALEEHPDTFVRDAVLEAVARTWPPK